MSTIGKTNPQSTIGFLKVRDTGIQPQVNPFVHQMTMYMRGNGKINRGHHLVDHFNNRDLGTCVLQILSHFETDKATAHHYCILHFMCVQVAFDTICIRHVPKGENTLKINPFQWRNHRIGARGKEQLVVALGVGSAVRLCYGHPFCACVDVSDLVFNTHIDIEALAKAFWGLHKKIVAV